MQDSSPSHTRTRTDLLQLARVLKAQRVKLLYNTLQELVANSPASKTCFRFLDLNIDRNLYTYLFKSTQEARLPQSTMSAVEKTLWVNEELIKEFEAVLKNRVAELLNVDDDSLYLEQIEFHSVLYNASDKLIAAAESGRSRALRKALDQIHSRAAYLKNRKAATMILAQHLKANRMRALSDGLLVLCAKEERQPLKADVFDSLEYLLARKVDGNMSSAFFEIRTYSKMRHLFIRKYGAELLSSVEQDIKLVQHFDDRPQLYLSVLAGNSDAKKHFLLLRVLDDIMVRGPRTSYGRVMIDGLRHKNKCAVNAKACLLKLATVVGKARLKVQGESFLLLKYTKQTLMNFKFALTLIHILHYNKKRYYFKQFHYNASQNKKPVGLMIEKTKNLTYNPKAKKDCSKLAAAINKIYKYRLFTAVTLIRIHQKPKAQVTNQKVVYGKVVALKVQNIPTASQRPSLMNLGSQDFEGNGDFIRVLRQQQHAQTVQRPIQRHRL